MFDCAVRNPYCSACVLARITTRKPALTALPYHVPSQASLKQHKAHDPQQVGKVELPVTGALRVDITARDLRRR